jgi:hypothetical protein
VSVYKVIFLGLSTAGPEEEVRLIKGLQKKFNLSPEKAESLLQRVPIVIKKAVSKEEVERYVKAFEDIGGKVRVEEEAGESFEISPEPGPAARSEREPYSGPKIICPRCGFEQPKTDQCVQCGTVISKYFQYQEMARSYEGKIPPGESQSPFESGEGFIGAFLKTTREALFSPVRFFKKVAGGEGYWTPLIYAMILGIIGFGGTILWQWFFFSHWFPVGRISGLSTTIYFIITVALPVIVAFTLLIESWVTHVCLMIVGGNKGGFQVTFRAIAYSFSGYLFGIIPFIGSPLGGIYVLVLTIIGVREGHDISTGKAVLAIFLPVIIAVGLGTLAAVLIPMFFGMFGFSRGMRV